MRSQKCENRGSIFLNLNQVLILNLTKGVVVLLSGECLHPNIGPSIDYQTSVE